MKKFPQSCPDKTAIYTVFLAAMQPQANTVLGTDSPGLSPAFRYASTYILRTYPHTLLRRDRETEKRILVYFTRICLHATRAWVRIRVYTRIRTCTYTYIHIYIYIHTYRYIAHTTARYSYSIVIARLPDTQT